MNIYKVWFNEWQGYDTWGGAVVIAEDERAALQMYPQRDHSAGHEQYDFCLLEPKTLAWDRCELIGPAPDGAAQRVILASFHAG